MVTRRQEREGALWLVAAALALSCVPRAPPVAERPPPAPPPAPPVVVPEGCLADQTGSLRHLVDERYRYEAHDDGGTLVLSVFLVPAVDAGRPPRRFGRDGVLPWLTTARGGSDGGAEPPGPAAPAPLAVVALARTPAGVVGAVRASSDGGCAFPARVVACRSDALVLESPLRRSASCEGGLDAGWSQQILVRAPPDSGAAPDGAAVAADDWRSTVAGPTDAKLVDAGRTDATPTDAGRVDANPGNSEPTDSRPGDAGRANAEPTDAGRTGAKPADAGRANAKPTDAGPTDPGRASAEPTDSRPGDAGRANAEPTDAGPADAPGQRLP